ncbi:hypothetical protein C8F04DRAFT_1175261 [Mycena alexandri]|uniref:Uncharacterized protein n=1 Tax=Mycena alexandri TaxID=1745969 RepID=A0AAD6TFN4_9AGAR|nr:hypothetical protein C8F04DRAFT_1175261 [Mycena alexandri]
MAKNNRRARKRSRTWKRTAKKDRRNLRLWAEGARESVLKPHIPAYTDALERGWRAERDYLHKVCKEFHALISWRLVDEEEPDLPLPPYDPFSTPEVEELDEEETTTKRLRIETLNARIGRWLKYRARALRRPVQMDRTRDPWAILLGKLAGINTPPKARQAFQQYMHESYETDIAPAVKARWEASALDDGGNARSAKSPDAPFRAKVARELFAELSDEEQAGLRQRAKDDAQRARDTYTAAMKAGPSKAPEDRQRCIDQLGPFISAILRGVSDYTGLHSFAVFGGPMPKHAGEIRTVTVANGRNQGGSACQFPQWAPARFNREVLDFMREFLQTAFSDARADTKMLAPAECAEAALPTDHNDPLDPLGQAKYTIHDPLAHSDASGSDSDSDGDSDDDSSSDSERDSAMEEDVDRQKEKKRAAKKAAAGNTGSSKTTATGAKTTGKAAGKAAGKQLI